jgi:hypothetical protein
MHATGIELDDTVGVRETPVTNARVFRVALDDVDACDDGVKRIGGADQKAKRLFDARTSAPISEAVPVVRCDDDRLHSAALDGGWLGQEPIAGQTRSNTRKRTGSNEVSPTDTSHPISSSSKRAVLASDHFDAASVADTIVTWLLNQDGCGETCSIRPRGLIS